MTDQLIEILVSVECAARDVERYGIGAKNLVGQRRPNCRLPDGTGASTNNSNHLRPPPPAPPLYTDTLVYAFISLLIIQNKVLDVSTKAYPPWENQGTVSEGLGCDGETTCAEHRLTRRAQTRTRGLVEQPPPAQHHESRTMRYRVRQTRRAKAQRGIRVQGLRTCTDMAEQSSTVPGLRQHIL